MAEATIEFSVGALSFSGTGDEKWLAQQLDKILKAAPDFTAAEHELDTPPPPERPDEHDDDFKTPLATYLRSKGAASGKQDRRFLVTADWLRRRGDTELSTSKVTKALKESHQSRLSNPSQSLSRNVTSGLLEKSGKNFFITPEGLEELAKLEG